MYEYLQPSERAQLAMALNTPSGRIQQMQFQEFPCFAAQRAHAINKMPAYEPPVTNTQAYVPPIEDVLYGQTMVGGSASGPFG